jgi:hypothetical protein
VKPGGSAAVCAFRSIMEHQTLATVDGVKVDLFSASCAVRVYDGLSPENRRKFEALPVVAMLAVSMKVLGNIRQRRGA